MVNIYDYSVSHPDHFTQLEVKKLYLFNTVRKLIYSFIKH